MKKVRNISWAVFILSLLFLGGVLVISASGPGQSGFPTKVPVINQTEVSEEVTVTPKLTGTPHGRPTTPASSATKPAPLPSPDGPSTGDMLTVVVPVVTAVGSLITGVTTTVMTVRRDRLEARRTELELEKMRLEILKMQKETEIELAKKQRELDELKGKDRP